MPHPTCSADAFAEGDGCRGLTLMKETLVRHPECSWHLQRLSGCSGGWGGCRAQRMNPEPEDRKSRVPRL